MLPRRHIEAYLRFLLRQRVPVAVVVTIITGFFVWYIGAKLTIFTNFFDLYPPKHPYIEVYQKYRKLFGTSNVLLMTIEAKNGDLFSDPEIIKVVDRITVELLHNVPGVNGEQVMSITHPKIKTTLTTGAGLKTVPLTYPRLPEDKEDLEFLRRKVDTTEGVRGFLVSQDDKATQIIAGFWEEYFDLAGMWKQIQQIVDREEANGKVKIYVSGPPVLFAYFNEAIGTMGWFLGGTAFLMIVLLWFYFRTIQGVVIPTFSALLSAVWGLGFAGLFGYSLDPLVIVVFVLITARTLSHSVQSMERYHEEYFRCKDKHVAIIRSYVSLYAPAMVSIIADGLAIMTIAVATIPLMRKLAFVSAFWIISIFISVVTLHPIILSFVRPPKTHNTNNAFSRMANAVGRRLVTLAIGNMRYAVVAMFIATMAFGGCLALHRELTEKVAFDPWVFRGEDLDYVINARLHGQPVYLDGQWRIHHNPPERSSEALKFRQTGFSFIYGHRKLEFARSQVDLHRVTANSLMPYPGEFLKGSITWRAFVTAFLRGVAGRGGERSQYFKTARELLMKANSYARANCDNYFAFQRRWPELMEKVLEDVALKSLYTGERSMDRSAITGRFPVLRPGGAVGTMGPSGDSGD